MSSDIAISVRGLSRAYRIGQQAEKHVTLAEQALAFARNPFKRAPKETFWALDDVSFDVPRGEVLGIIGRNGAGKSTLLKVMSRITPPTKGEVRLYGRIGSLLEVGTGFHPELTGRENIYLNGSILGMRRKEIDRQFDEIVDFAGVERFLDTPVKRYSSGMYVRLAFAVAAHLDTEILLVDEVLAVGDAEFQKKCLGKMGEVADGGRTVLVVSHSMDLVARLSARSLMLSGGRLMSDSPTSLAIAAYLEDVRAANSRPLVDAASRRGSGEFRIVLAEALGAPYGAAERKVFRIVVDRRRGEFSRYFVSAHIVDTARRVIAQCDSRLSQMWIDHSSIGTEVVELSLESPWLKPGRYELDLYVCNAGVLDECRAACSFEVTTDLPYPGVAPDEALAEATILPGFVWRHLAAGE